MVELPCPMCGETISIDWHLNGEGLVEMDLRVDCTRCNAPLLLVVEFPENKAKIKKVTSTYIG